MNESKHWVKEKGVTSTACAFILENEALDWLFWGNFSRLKSHKWILLTLVMYTESLNLASKG